MLIAIKAWIELFVAVERKMLRQLFQGNRQVFCSQADPKSYYGKCFFQ